MGSNDNAALTFRTHACRFNGDYTSSLNMGFLWGVHYQAPFEAKRGTYKNSLNNLRIL